MSALNGSPPMVLLGAGASVPAGLPTAHELTRTIGRDCKNELAPAYRAIVEALGGDADIERVLNATMFLADRHSDDVAPFIDVWKAEISQLENQFAQHQPGHEGSLFRSLAAYLHSRLLKCFWLEDDRSLGYLDPLLKCARERRLTLATLNYDNCVELRSRSLQIAYDNGIDHWLRAHELPILSSGIEILKLHGSIDWFWSTASPCYDPRFDYRTIAEVPSAQMPDVVERGVGDWWHAAGEQLAILFGGRNKLRAGGPFLDLLLKFRSRLNSHHSLIAIGYSFRDEHVNTYIRQWIQENHAEKIVIIERQNAQATDNRFLDSLHGLWANKIQFLPVGAEQGIADIFSA